MSEMSELLLLTGIPGTGKTTYGAVFADQFGFINYDLEEKANLSRLATNATGFIQETTRHERVVVTWGFLPDAGQISLVLQFREAKFKLIWLDGNRPAALAAFRGRGTVPEILFYAQMFRIEQSRVVEQIQPTVLNPFDAKGNFKSAGELLREIRSLG